MFFSTWGGTAFAMGTQEASTANAAIATTAMQRRGAWDIVTWGGGSQRGRMAGGGARKVLVRRTISNTQHSLSGQRNGAWRARASAPAALLVLLARAAPAGLVAAWGPGDGV